jgi:hypothetical protein
MRCRKCPPRTAGRLLVSAISETCPPGEGMLLKPWSQGRVHEVCASLHRQHGVPGDRPEAARPGCALGCQEERAGSGAARRRLEQERKV